jgi:hypothetical protein
MQQAYPIYDQELLALVRGLLEWRIYLEGTPHQITVYMDHKNLQYFRTAQKLQPCQTGYSLLLSQFDLQLVHKPRKTMMLSDPLSRRSNVEEQKDTTPIKMLLPDQLFIDLIDTNLSQ